MDLRSRNKLDCKITIRKYVLVAQPTRWAQRGGRVVVHSPILSIDSSVSSVPVKCHRGSDQNDVDFIPRSDIEKDTKDIYEKSYVSKQPSVDYAHGVAAFDSTCAGDFEYKRGHRFWISIGPNTTDFQNTVRVVNLDTHRAGIIDIDQVRWFPTVKGPGAELWTLGGIIKRLKLAGKNNYKDISWAICQYSNGKPPITKDFAILPAKDDPLADSSYLSIPESQLLFDSQCKTMESVCPRVYPLTPLPTPTPEPHLPQPQWHETELFGRLRKQAEARKRKGNSYVLWTSSISTKRSKLQHKHQTIRAKIGIQSNWDEIHHDPSNYSTLQSITRGSSPSSQCSADIDSTFVAKQSRAEVLCAAIKLMDMRRNEGQAVMSLRDHGAAHDAADEYWKQREGVHNVLLDGHCDLKNLECPYIRKSTAKHFHSPPNKCRLALASISLTQRHPKDGHKARPHECCVSRLGPFPASRCILASSPTSYPDHHCCEWSAADMQQLIGVQKYENLKVSEARRGRLKLEDMTSYLSYHIKPNVNINYTSVLDEGGTALFASLDNGIYDDQIPELTVLKFKSEDIMGSWTADLDSVMGFG